MSTARVPGRQTEDRQLNQEPFAAATWGMQEDFELECIREFSHSGLHLGVGVSRAERRERIRAAILREDKCHLRWRESNVTYADMYSRTYRETLGSGNSHKEDAGLGKSRHRQVIDDSLADDEEEAFEGNDGISA